MTKYRLPEYFADDVEKRLAAMMAAICFISQTNNNFKQGYRDVFLFVACCYIGLPILGTITCFKNI